MNKKTLLGLSAILFVLIGTPACSYCTRSHGGPGLNNQDGSVLRADGEPLPPFPYPGGISATSVPRADGEPLPPFPWGLHVSSDTKLS